MSSLYWGPDSWTLPVSGGSFGPKVALGSKPPVNLNRENENEPWIRNSKSKSSKGKLSTWSLQNVQLKSNMNDEYNHNIKYWKRGHHMGMHKWCATLSVNTGNEEQTAHWHEEHQRMKQWKWINENWTRRNHRHGHITSREMQWHPQVATINTKHQHANWTWNIEHRHWSCKMREERNAVLQWKHEKRQCGME